MKLSITFSFQIGFLISLGVNYENRLYISIDLPLCYIHIMTFKL